MTENTNIWLDGIMGVVVGDALGCPVQFESREEVARHPVAGMRGYGTFNLPEETRNARVSRARDGQMTAA